MSERRTGPSEMSTRAEDEPIRVGRDVYVPDGTKLGTIATVYGPAGTSDETWIAVDAGISDGPYIVPCDGAGLFSEGLQVRHPVEEVQASPHVSTGDELTDGQLAELSDYYHLTRRTSLNPGSAEADDMPSRQPRKDTESVSRDGTTEAAAGAAGDGADAAPTDAGEVDDAGTDIGDGPRPAGTVTVSGADADVALGESDRLHAARSDARAAAGYQDTPGTDH